MYTVQFMKIAPNAIHCTQSQRDFLAALAIPLFGLPDLGLVEGLLKQMGVKSNSFNKP